MSDETYIGGIPHSSFPPSHDEFLYGQIFNLVGDQLFMLVVRDDVVGVQNCDHCVGWEGLVDCGNLCTLLGDQCLPNGYWCEMEVLP